MLCELPLSGKELLDLIRDAGKNKKKLKRFSGQASGASKQAYILNRGQAVLSSYIGELERHIRSVPLHKHVSDRELLTSREQYFLYMIEIELVNRLNLEQFRTAKFKIALLPYCLKESHSNCKASPDEIDMQCMSCLKNCYINRVGAILRKHNINPYILSRGKVSTMLKGVSEKHGSIGVLGIACIVELVMGMRLCMNSGLPVTGIPLNANLCPRWMGSMHDTSIDLQALDKLCRA